MSVRTECSIEYMHSVLQSAIDLVRVHQHDDQRCTVDVSDVKIRLSYQWESVLSASNKVYFFPQEITPFMMLRYKRPAIYRWDVHRSIPGDKKRVYIGQAKELCPDHIRGYLNPGPTQETNKRISHLFEGFLRDGLKITLDVCSIDGIELYSSEFIPMSLGDKHVRLLVESAIIMEHKHKGFSLLNL